MPQVIRPISLVERKNFDDKLAHQVAPGVWWVGYLDADQHHSHNPFLIVDKDDAVLINPGSRAEEHYRLVRDKIASIIPSEQIQHIVVLHNDPERCASLPLFAKLASRDVRLYSPSRLSRSVKHYGCRNGLIGLEDGDSILFDSGRTLDYHDLPNLPCAGSGLLFDGKTHSLFIGSLMDCFSDGWNLFAAPESWERHPAPRSEEKCSRKGLLGTLNKIERLAPERICSHTGPIIEEEIDKFLAAVRDRAAD